MTISASSSSMSSSSMSSLTSTPSTTGPTTPGLRLTNEKMKSVFVRIATKGFDFKVNGVDYYVGTTKKGFVIQPHADYLDGEYTGYYISRDFLHTNDDETPNTQIALQMVMTKVAIEYGSLMS